MLVMNGIGRLGQEPEMIQTQSGTSLVNLSLACDSNKKKEDGIGKETIWLNAVAFGKSAEIILQYYHKGYKIYFTGNVQNDKWIDKNTGQQREKIKIIIQYSENLTSRKEAEEMGYTTQPSQYQQSQMQQGYQPNQGQQPQMQQGYQLNQGQPPQQQMQQPQGQQPRTPPQPQNLGPAPQPPGIRDDNDIPF